jgi:hypothetical protein
MESSRLFALLNLAMADALIACMDCKYEYCFWRPITAIHALEAEEKPETTPIWEPLLVTPAYPDYVSSHSMLVNAAVTVLAKVLGDDCTDIVLEPYLPSGSARHYTDFSEIAEEASVSRVFGGVHFRFSCELGLLLGRNLGEYVWMHCLQPV